MPRKILVVDDDAEFRQEFKDFLEGYDVVEAPNGKEALNILKRANEICLVILDVMMPGASGLDVLSEIKKIEPSLPIVILTGHSSKDVAIEALKGKADDFIEKPLDPEKVKDIVNKALEAARQDVNIDTTSLAGKIEKIKLFTEHNCFKKITLKDAAELVCLSSKYLSRIFKEETKQSYSQYRLKLKIEKAKELLAKSALNINQISDKLGYENAESFIRQFKKLTKRTPTEFRNKIRSAKKKRR